MVPHTIDHTIRSLRNLMLPILPRTKKPAASAGHSKSLRHHTAMQALFVAWYNFALKHEALKNTTPAMASKLTDHVWTIKELIEKAAG
jgi:hypothetical protein